MKRRPRTVVVASQKPAKKVAKKRAKKVASQKPAKKPTKKKVASQKPAKKRAKKVASQKPAKKRAKKVASQKPAKKRAKKVASQKPSKKRRKVAVPSEEMVVIPAEFRMPAERKSKSGANPLVIGGVVLGGILLLAVAAEKKKLKKGHLPVTESPPPETPRQPPPTAGPSLTPAQVLAVEYRRAKNADITPVVAALAPSYLGQPMGSIHFRNVDGTGWAFVLEEHYRDPASAGPGPKGKHKGVSMFIRKDGIA